MCEVTSDGNTLLKYLMSNPSLVVGQCWPVNPAYFCISNMVFLSLKCFYCIPVFNFITGGWFQNHPKYESKPNSSSACEGTHTDTHSCSNTFIGITVFRYLESELDMPDMPTSANHKPLWGGGLQPQRQVLLICIYDITVYCGWVLL